jgi:hypothetical protein
MNKTVVVIAGLIGGLYCYECREAKGWVTLRVGM